MQIYNTTNDEIGVRIPTLAIQEIEKFYSPRTIDQKMSYSNIIKGLGVTNKVFSVIKSNINEDRFEKLKPLLNLEYLNVEEKNHVERLVKKYSDCFHIPSEPLGSTNYYKHRIPTTYDIPFTTEQYRLPHSLKVEVDKQIIEGLQSGIMKPSESPYNSTKNM